MALLRATQFLPGISTYLEEELLSKKNESALKKLAWFSLSTKSPLRLPQRSDPALIFLSNLLSKSERGLPNPFVQSFFETNKISVSSYKSRYLEAPESENRFLKMLNNCLDIRNPSLGFHSGNQAKGNPGNQARMSLVHEEYRDLLELVWSPAAAARIERALVEVIMGKQLDLEKKRWRILIVEQDLPCAQLAIASFSHHMDLIFKMENKGRKLPEIDLVVIGNMAFKGTRLRAIYPVENSRDFSSGEEFDLVIDHGILLETGNSNLIYEVRAKERIVLRSVMKSTKEFPFHAQSGPVTGSSSPNTWEPSFNYIFDWLFGRRYGISVNSRLFSDPSGDQYAVYTEDDPTARCCAIAMDALVAGGFCFWLVHDQDTKAYLNNILDDSEIGTLFGDAYSFKVPQQPWSGHRIMVLDSSDFLDPAVQVKIKHLIHHYKHISLAFWDANRISYLDPDLSIRFRISVFSLLNLVQEFSGKGSVKRLIGCSESSLDNYLELSRIFKIPFEKFQNSGLKSRQFELKAIEIQTLSSESELSVERSALLNAHFEQERIDAADQIMVESNSLKVMQRDKTNDIWFLHTPPSLLNILRAKQSVHGSIHTLYHRPETGSMSTDLIRQRENLEKQYKGAKKEFCMIEEFFKKLGAPSFLEQQNELSDLVSSRFELDVRIQVAGLRLYVYIPNTVQGLGYIDLYNWRTQPDSSTVDKAEEVLNFMLEHFQEKYRNTPAPLNAIREHFRMKTGDGILKMLKDHPRKKSSFELLVPPTNDLDVKISDLLRFMFEKEAILYKIEITLQSEALMELSLDENLFRKCIEQACFETTVPHDFIGLLNKFYQDGLVEQHRKRNIHYKEYHVSIRMPASHQVQDEIENILLSIRSLQDTELAICRLLETGIIETVSCKPLSKVYKLSFINQKAEGFISRYYHFVEPYLTPNQLRNLLEDLIEVQDKFEELLKRILDSWISFFYEKIFPVKMYHAREVYDIILKTESLEDSFWENWISSYHLNPESFHGKSLNFLSSTGKIEDLWRFIDEILQNPRDTINGEFEHLQNSLTKWKEQYPENELVDLLLAFCMICQRAEPVKDGNGQQEELEPTILELLQGGMISYARKNEIDNQKLVVYLDTFYKKILAFDSSLAGIMEQASEYIVLVWYNDWLKDFKNKFISSSNDQG